MNPILSATVIVCTRNRPEHLLACLAALKRQTGARLDVLVVDNSATGSALATCKREGAGYLHEPVPGLSRARNAGARAARGDVVAFIDDDAIPEPDWIEKLLVPFQDATISAATGTILYMKSDGDSRVMSEEVADDTVAPRPPAVFGPETRRWFTAACFGGIGDGSNMAFRRTLFGPSVQFDERLGRGRLLDGGEDHVIFVAMIERGHRVAHVPEAVVRHPASADPATRQARAYQGLRTTIAYILHLLAEFPAHRTEIAGFLARAVLKRVVGVARSKPDHLPRALAVRALIQGPILYWRALHGARLEPMASESVTQPRYSRSSL